MYTFNTWRDPYDEGFSTCSRKQVTLEEGVTVLVGCNGSGKTTLIANLKDVLKQNKIPYYYFDNLSEGGATARGAAVAKGDYAFGATAMMSSEGENINLNLCTVMANIREFLATGETPKSKENKELMQIFGRGVSEETINTNLRFILLDGVDSGYSIDNIIELKEAFNLILEDAKGLDVELYIIITANEYELATEMPCMDVTNGKYLKFASYKSFKSFILKSRKKKDNRVERTLARQR